MEVLLDSTQSAVLTLPNIRENLAKGVYNEVWTSQGTRNRKRAAINNGEKIFRFEGGYMDPSEMPTSREEVEFFCDTILAGRKFHPKSGLKSARQVAAWRDEYCSVCDVASGRRAFEMELRTRQDDWSLMIDVLVGSCRECCGNSLAARSGHVKVRFLRRRGQGASARWAERGSPIRRPCASGSGRRRAAPRAAWARSRRRAARSGS
jgi:hypothetical protein